jgi:hypothetical protein
MTTPISFELSKLLKEKGYDKHTCNIYPLVDFWGYKKGELSLFIEESLDEAFAKESNFYCLAPTITEVIMWLHEKHSLWILPLPTVTGHFAYKIVDVQLSPEKPIERPPYKDVSANDYNSPTEAYEAAIKHCLEKII